MTMLFTKEEFHKIKSILPLYKWAQKTLLTKLSIIHEDHINFHKTNPIEHITGRIKAPENIAEKLHRLNVGLTAEDAVKHIKDIAGIRIICPFAKDIYYLLNIIRSMPDVNITEEKDYISNPKPSGYRSYHIIADIPVFYSNKTELISVEVQIRTEAMNFWAVLEHKARYKYKGGIPDQLKEELSICAEKISELDERMFIINECISTQNNA